MNKYTIPPFIANNKIKINYRAGSGERFLSTITVWDGKEWVRNQDGDAHEIVEDFFDHIIRQHEHDNACGYGYFISENGTITKSEYDNS